MAAVIWEAGRLVLAELLIDDRYTAYGMVGSLLVLMLWAYFATSVLLLGAEYVQVIRESKTPMSKTSPLEEVPAAVTADSDASDSDASDTIRLQQLEHGFRRWQPKQRDSRAA